MKKNLTLILFGFLPLFALSQIQQAFNYQAAVRNADGEIQFDTIANFKIEILQNDSIIYSENHFDKETGKTGVVNFKVGLGEILTGDFSQIDWSSGQLQISTTLNGEPMGTADIVPVPISLYALNSGDNHWQKTTSGLYYLESKVGIGTDNFDSNKVKIQGDSNELVLGVFQGDDTANNGVYFKSPNSPTSGRIFIAHDIFSLGRGGGSNTRALNIRNNGNVGIGINNPSDPLDVLGLIRVRGDNSHQKLRFYSSESDQDNRITSYDENSDLMWQIMMGRRSNSDRFEIDRPGNGVSEFYIDLNSRTHVRTLQIHGGGDVKEDFNSSDTLEPGDVVVIDKNNPGQIRKTNEEYDRKVAGIISGANGINPGISLSQDDVLEGDYPLAMLGRVYVKVTGKVNIGDMLTTSSKFGYAMAVEDYTKAHGSVIGKAMTKNETGEGMVLVLVNLQ